ncbi:MAG: Lrp/AsnC ligand binding domain-containing protein [Thaumarchaeota archaeon]|nr:MAG: AsnC/Lrp family regulatory protein [Nitrosopumilales archaeon]MCZ6582019.1 Lrp/AsnC ligand binding domain-containing protein [Nitrososphaerota archaeon]
MHLGYILLSCDLGSEDYVVEELKRIPEIKNAYVTFGAYDIIVELEAKSQEDFDNTVTHKVRRLPRVLSTVTLNVVKREG